MVGASGGGRAEDDRTRGLPVLRPDGEVTEELTSFVEDAELLREEDAGLGASASVIIMSHIFEK